MLPTSPSPKKTDPSQYSNQHYGTNNKQGKLTNLSLQALKETQTDWKSAPSSNIFKYRWRQIKSWVSSAVSHIVAFVRGFWKSASPPPAPSNQLPPAPLDQPPPAPSNQPPVFSLPHLRTIDSHAASPATGNWIIVDVGESLKGMERKLSEPLKKEEISAFLEANEEFDRIPLLLEDLEGMSGIGALLEEHSGLELKIQHYVKENQDVFVTFLKELYEKFDKNEIDDSGYQSYCSCHYLLAVNKVDLPKHLLQESPLLESVIFSGIGIPNVGNSCYRIASTQALRVFKPFLKILKSPLTPRSGEDSKDFSVRVGIRRALVNLIECLEHKKSKEEIQYADLILSLTIATSRLHPEFHYRNIYAQQDAAAYMETILGLVLDDYHTIIDQRSADQGKLVFKRNSPENKQALIQVALLPEVNDFQKLIDATFEPVEQNNPDEPWKPEGFSFQAYTQTTRVVSQPKDVLVVQLKRAVYPQPAQKQSSAQGDEKQELEKEQEVQASLLSLFGHAPILNKQPVEFPPDGIIDFSKAYDRPEGSLKYQIKGLVCHHGFSAASGHYTSYVKKDEQHWYHCNDDWVSIVDSKSLSDEKGNTYLVLLEKVS